MCKQEKLFKLGPLKRNWILNLQTSKITELSTNSYLKYRIQKKPKMIKWIMDCQSWIPIVKSSYFNMLQRTQDSGQLWEQKEFFLQQNFQKDVILSWTLIWTVFWLVQSINMFNKMCLWNTNAPVFHMSVEGVCHKDYACEIWKVYPLPFKCCS